MKKNSCFSKIISLSGAVVLAISSCMAISCSSESSDNSAQLLMLSTMNKDNNSTQNPDNSQNQNDNSQTPSGGEQNTPPANNQGNNQQTPSGGEHNNPPAPSETENEIDESSITWNQVVSLNTNCVTAGEVNLIFQTTSIPDDADTIVTFNGTLYLSYNGKVKKIDSTEFSLPFNKYSDATPKGYQLKINLKQIFADALFVAGDTIKISLTDVTMKTENVEFVQMVIVDSSEAAGWYKYLSETHEVNIWEKEEVPGPSPTPTPETKTVELTKNEYDASYDDAHTYCGIQAKIPLRKALSDYPGIAINDTYVVTLKGTASRDFTAQILLYDDTETAGYRALSAWGDNANFTAAEFNITKEIVLETVPTSSAAVGKAWDVEKSFSLMIDVPAGASATADIPPATLSFTEFKVEKKSGGSSAPVITDWTLVNDFSSATIASGWQKADWTNGDMFNCWWDPENITFNESSNGLMKMKICQNSNPSHTLAGNVMAYNGAELRTTGTYGYGYYEVRMKPCKASGTNSSFFLYTKDDEHNIEWNEVDIEFITKDMGDGRGLRSIPQFNFFIDNAGEGHEFLYTDLEFDASTAFHVYGIEYAADHISWYVDGTKVYTATGCKTSGHNHSQGTLPSHNMQIMVNFWPGTPSVDDWLGHFSYSTPLYAEYDYIKFKAAE